MDSPSIGPTQIRARLVSPSEPVKGKEVAGDRMPHKSTYFYPKPLTGLVINRMD
jgi:hypothetical protein